MDIQFIFVILVLIIAISYAAARVHNTFNHKKDCNNGCEGCNGCNMR